MTDNNKRPPSSNNDVFSQLAGILYDGEDPRKTSKSGLDALSESNIQAYNFLQMEVERLKRIDSLFNEKLNTIQRYSTIDHILEEQEQQIAVQKNQVVQELITPDSSFLDNMSMIFNRVFFNIKKTDNISDDFTLV